MLSLLIGNKKPWLVLLPTQPVAKDATWEHGEFVGFASLGGVVAVKRTLTLISVERIGERRVARIQIRGESPVSGEYTYPVGALHIKLSLNGTMKLTGEILWLVDQGRIQRFAEEASLDTPVRVEAERLTTMGGFRFKSVERVEDASNKN